MKRYLIYCILVLLIIPVTTTPQTQKRLLETVDVVDVIVPVRVFNKGKQVDNLTRSDFIIYENGKKQNINAFFIKKSKIQVQSQDNSSTSDGVPPSKSSRYFVLIFRINDYHRELQKGLDYVFRNILTEEDQLMVFMNNKNLSFANLKKKDQAQHLINRTLKTEARLARHQMSAMVHKIERDTYRYVRIWQDHPQSVFAALDYLNMLLRIWREYKRNYLVPDLKKYFYFSKHLEKIKKEKWVLNFYQMPMFPKLKQHGKMRIKLRSFADQLQVDSAEWGQILHKSMDQMDKEMAISSDFPVKDLSKLFYKVNATFHTIFLPTNIEGFSKDFEFKEATTSIENSLRDITRKTGGTLTTTTNLKNALDKIEKKENICYVLSYAPLNPDIKGKIKIKLANSKYRLIYDNNMRADYIVDFFKKQEEKTPSIKITGVSFKGKKLKLKVENFLLRTVEKNTFGKIEIRIQVLDHQNKSIYDQKKSMLTVKPTINVSIPFTWIKTGTYNIIVDVIDLITKKANMKYLLTKIT